MALPRMDLPIGAISWEVFVPERYSVRRVGGNVIDAMTSWPHHSRSGVPTQLEGHDAVVDRSRANETAGRRDPDAAAGLAGGVVGTVQEHVTLSSASPKMNAIVQPSQNVVNLQQRVAGVLPVRVDVPREGTSHVFSKPLVIDQETTVTFQYRRR